MEFLPIARPRSTPTLARGNPALAHGWLGRTVPARPAEALLKLLHDLRLSGWKKTFGKKFLMSRYAMLIAYGKFSISRKLDIVK